jgi:DNA-binding NarL/FixJ family response regulator
MCEQRGDHTYLGYVLTVIARTEWMRGAADVANAYLRKALQLRRTAPHPPTLVVCIDLLAWIAESTGEHRRAAVLLAAGHQISQTFGLSQARAALNVPHAQCEARTREALGEESYEIAFRRGSQLDIDSVIAFALREPTKPDSAHVRADEPAPALTTRERQVAELVAEGLSNKQIATRLVIAQRTAESHIEHILLKLGFSSRTQIAAWVVEISSDETPIPVDSNGNGL